MDSWWGAHGDIEGDVAGEDFTIGHLSLHLEYMGDIGPYKSVIRVC